MRPLALAILFVAAVVGDAAGNGRPPQTNGVFFQPNDPAALYVRTTFGLLVSRDDGCSFRWVCEKAIGYGGEFDPKYAIAADGTIFATTFTGLRVSRDGGCTWVTATADAPATDPGRIADIWIDALDISASGTIWVATAESAKPNNIYSSADNGVTFEPRGMLSPTIWWKSVKTARSDPQRVYVTGYQVAGVLPDGGQSQPVAHLVRSSNGGETWTELSLDGKMMFGATPIVLVHAVDPTDPGTLLVTSVGANYPGDRVYRSTDAGVTFTEVAMTPQPVKDLLFTADGTVVIATLGGSFRSTDRGATFSPLDGAPQLQCIGQRADGQLVGCGANWDPDFKAVALSTDGSAWNKLFRFVDLSGPLACPAGTTNAEQCDPLWPTLQQQFGATGTSCGLVVDAPPPPPKDPGGCCEANAGGGAMLGALALVGWVLWIMRRPARRPRR